MVAAQEISEINLWVYTLGDTVTSQVFTLAPRPYLAKDDLFSTKYLDSKG
jgi:hypothetical protein